MVTTIEIAAAEALECDTEELNKEKYDYYGLDVYSYRGEEFAIGFDEEATEAAKQIIIDSIWTFKPEFVASHTKAGASNGMIAAIKALQADCEDSNDNIKSLIDNIDAFVEDAIAADGRGTFLASYDSEEREIDVNGIVFYCYRIN